MNGTLRFFYHNMDFQGPSIESPIYPLFRAYDISVAAEITATVTLVDGIVVVGDKEVHLFAPGGEVHAGEGGRWYAITADGSDYNCGSPAAPPSAPNNETFNWGYKIGYGVAASRRKLQAGCLADTDALGPWDPASGQSKEDYLGVLIGFRFEVYTEGGFDYFQNADGIWQSRLYQSCEVLQPLLTPLIYEVADEATACIGEPVLVEFIDCYQWPSPSQPSPPGSPPAEPPSPPASPPTLGINCEGEAEQCTCESLGKKDATQEECQAYGMANGLIMRLLFDDPGVPAGCLIDVREGEDLAFNMLIINSPYPAGEPTTAYPLCWDVQSPGAPPTAPSPVSPPSPAGPSSPSPPPPVPSPPPSPSPPPTSGSAAVVIGFSGFAALLICGFGLCALRPMPERGTKNKLVPRQATVVWNAEQQSLLPSQQRPQVLRV